MSATTVYAGLAARFATVAGLKAIILGEPTAIHVTPALYTALASISRPLRNSPPARNIVGTEYTFTHRLIIRWQDNQQAEADLLALVDAIPLAVDADPHLGGRLTSGMAYLASGTAGFVTIAGTLYRMVDYTGTVLEKQEAT